VEISQALGVFGVIAFLFVFGLRVFKLLPNEARALDDLKPSPKSK
jgi:hypothetical protein